MAARAGELDAARVRRRDVHAVATPARWASPASTIVDQPAAGRGARRRRDPPRARSSATARSVAGDVMTVTLACDHRILYGAHAARFLHEMQLDAVGRTGVETGQIAPT